MAPASQSGLPHLRLAEIRVRGGGDDDGFISKWIGDGEARAKMRVRVLHLARIPRTEWDNKHFSPVQGVDGAFKLKWKAQKTPFRAAGYDHRNVAIMKLLSSSRDRLLKRLKEFAYRHAWAEAHVTNGIAFQLRAMRKARGWDQEQLAQKAFGNPKLQSLISRYENPDYGKYSLSTLFDFARAFDVVLQVRYAPFSELIKWEEDLPSADLNVPSFAEQMQTDVLAKDSPRAPILVRGRGARRGRIGHRAPL